LYIYSYLYTLKVLVVIYSLFSITVLAFIILAPVTNASIDMEPDVINIEQSEIESSCDVEIMQPPHTSLWYLNNRYEKSTPESGFDNFFSVAGEMIYPDMNNPRGKNYYLRRQISKFIIL
jgi:hypothetical protein